MRLYLILVCIIFSLVTIGSNTPAFAEDEFSSDHPSQKAVLVTGASSGLV